MEPIDEVNTGSSTPRKFTIRSDFGRPRQYRSRKNRPCDVCRRRKTACIITTEPPCDFCKSKGLQCQSLREDNEHSVTRTETDHVVSRPPTVSPISPLSQVTDENENNNQSSDSAAVVHHGLVHQSQSGPADRQPVARDSNVHLHETLEPVVHTLEDNPHATTHSMGLAAEQDPYFMDAFRPLLISDLDGIDAGFIQVYQGGIDPDDHPIHFLLLQNEFPAHRNDARRAASDAVENIVWPHSSTLVRLYFRHVHPVLPVLSKGRFLRQYATAKESLPASLRGAVYALACIFWNQDPDIVEPVTFPQHELVNHAQDSLRRELEAPNLSKLQASILLMHMAPPDVDSVETPYTWIMAAQVTACAQMIGLHQDATKWNIAPWEKHLRRKLWWAAYLTDSWSSVCHGNPPHIGSNSFTTLPLDLDDLRADEELPQDLRYMVDAIDATFHVSNGARFLEMVNISQHLRSILDCSCSVTTTTQSRGGLVIIREKLKEWGSLVPNCLAFGSQSHNGSLHLSYYATQCLMFRGLIYPATRATKVTPGSNLRQWLSLALSEFRQFTAFIDQLTEKKLIGFWGRYARSQFILCGNFLIYLFLLATEPSEIEVAYRLLEQFRQSIQRLGSTDNVAAKLMLRPVILRIESFFKQASELIKTGRSQIIDPRAVRA